MNNYTHNLAEKMNGLLEKNYDAEKGFKKAADNAKHSGLKSYFTNKAKERYDFGHELKSELKSFNHQTDDVGNILGAAHCSWMEVKSWFSVDGDEAMLEESIKGEKASVNEYNEVLNDAELPDTTKEMLEIQKNTIEHSLINIKRLEDLI